MTTGSGDGLMRLLRQIADDLAEVRREERSHVSRLDRTIGRVQAIEALFRAVQLDHGGAAVDHLPHIPGPPRIDSGPAADIQLLPPAKSSGVDILAAAQALIWRGVPAVLARASIEVLVADGTIADLRVPHAGIESEFVAALAAAGIGVAFLERRVAYPLVAEPRALLAGA
jgi:hypothetical protein